ncbi:hypothetical protein [Kitasatospora sp. NPDC050463]|uniref:hypothetical protein n=1 Tax=Kitasatospora sp. NPDC050463 TaxID=3155786 RepID=UPI003402FADE
MLFYFGWSRQAALTEYIGFPQAEWDTGTSGFLLDSVSAIFFPIVVGLLVLIGWRLVDPAVRRWYRATEPERLTSSWKRGIGLSTRALLLLSWLVVPAIAWLITHSAVDPGWWQLAEPASLAAGVLLAAYGVVLARHAETGSGPTWWSSPTWLLITGLTVALLFWTVHEFAVIEGHGEAAQFIQRFKDQPGITLYSHDDLRMVAPGIRVTRYASPGAYEFRYQGLHLFARSGGRLLLLPDGWTFDQPYVFVIREDDQVRIEYSR